jgi:hypothetical protein
VTQISREQAREVLRQQALAQTTLTGYARYVDIPGVPDETDVDDRQFSVVETPLARHHVLILNVLQLLVDGLLLYDPQTLDSPADFALLRGDDVGVGVGRTDGGVPSDKDTPPLPTPHKSIPILPNSNISQTYSPNGSSRLEDSRVVLREVLSGRLPLLDAIELLASLFSGGEVCRRVMLMLPPGSAKSTYASVVFPTWVMGRNKAFETILTGWGDPICRRHGKRARQICASPQYRALFGVGLDPKTTAAEDWALTNSSSYKSSGISSGVAGFRANGLIWDDLTKNRKEADSETIRNDVFNAYIDDARSRKTPKAWEVGIGTRWHEDEIMGRVLPEGYSGESGFMRCRDGNVWYVICMAAECEHDNDPLGREIGEMIWPEWFDHGYWAEKRANPRSWGSLYQQRPAPEEGIIFKQEYFKYYDKLPDGDTYISYDPGVSDEGDETAMHVWRVDDRARIYLVSEYYGKMTADVWIQELITRVKINRPVAVVSEAGVIRRAVEPFLKRAMLQTKTFFAQHWVTRSANKQAMAAGAIGIAASGNLYLPRNDDGELFKRDCLMFPASKNDHRVDSFVNLCLHLEQIWAAQPVKVELPAPDVIDGSSFKIRDMMPPRFSKKKSRWAYTRPS